MGAALAAVAVIGAVLGAIAIRVLAAGGSLGRLAVLEA